MAYDLFQVIASWQQIGVYGVLLPFVLIFTITFAILEKTQILGTGKKNLNLIVSLVMGLLFLQNIYLVERIQLLLPNISYAVLFFLMFLLLVGTLTGTTHSFSAGKWLLAAFVLAALALLWATTADVSGYGFLDWWASMDDSLKQMVFLAAFIGLVIYFVQKPDTPVAGGTH